MRAKRSHPTWMRAKHRGEATWGKSLGEALDVDAGVDLMHAHIFFWPFLEFSDSLLPTTNQP